ncbi:Solute carrier family 2, facilitated glucose transporter member 12 [Holothuria leucospilota]|uniref:Solute carrier family 2, facilitated glucose transporter member 12 n=1 Tax=Holothuria leucospilota TaxID=206669 RepID=A0A9Q1BWT6_HOLLE|nr:Solute carrier family 2, facilitated glucose transporter member 12 [Holothuria leucospilota]
MEIPLEKVKLLNNDESSDDGDEESYPSQKVTLEDGQYFDGSHGDLTMTGSDEANFWLYLATSMAAVGGITFGYDMGIVSGALLQLKPEMGLTCRQEEVIVSSMLAGVVIGSLTGGFLLDWFGRRTTLLFNALVLLIGTAILSMAPTYRILVVGRLVVGYGIAVSSTGECVYVSEISPAAKRGKFVLLNETGICLGILLAYLVNFFLIRTDGGWRYMFLMAALPAIGQAMGMYLLPESPRYLLMKDKDTESYITLQKLRCTTDVLEEWTDLKDGIKQERAHKKNLWDLCGSHMNMKGRLLIGIGLVFFMEITGQTAVIYYAPTIFQVLGFSSKSAATLATVGLGFTKLLSSVVALFSVDVIGRRKLLLLGGCMMAVVITLLGAVIQVLPSPTSHSLCDTRVTAEQTKPAAEMIEPELKPHRMIRDNNDLSHISERGKFSSIRSIFTESEISKDTLPEMDDNLLFDDSKLHKDYDFQQGIMVKSGKRALSLVGSPGGHQPSIPTSEDLLEQTNKQTASFLPKFVAVFSLMVYVFGFSLGYGPGMLKITKMKYSVALFTILTRDFPWVVWLLLSEIFPAEYRGRASSIANSVKVVNILISLTFLDILNAIGASSTFFVFGAICCTSVIFIFLFVPETKGKSLEDISIELSKRKFCRCLESDPFKLVTELCCSKNYHIA